MVVFLLLPDELLMQGILFHHQIKLFIFSLLNSSSQFLNLTFYTRLWEWWMGWGGWRCVGWEKLLHLQQGMLGSLLVHQALFYI